jgi:hypothetical protein
MTDYVRLRALLDAATPGPWTADDTSDWTNETYGDDEEKPAASGWFRNCGVGQVDAGDYSTLTFADATLIAEGINALPALLTRLEALEAVAEAARHARAVATIWRDAYMENVSARISGEWALGTHPLTLVLAALDGETAAVHLGCDPDELRRTLAALDAPKEGAS